MQRGTHSLGLIEELGIDNLARRCTVAGSGSKDSEDNDSPEVADIEGTGIEATDLEIPICHTRFSLLSLRSFPLHRCCFSCSRLDCSVCYGGIISGS